MIQNLETTEQRISNIAQQVLNGRIKNTDILPVEVEVYWYSELHPDDAAQLHPLQMRNNQLYFYRAGKGNSLRPLSRMGVGVSFSTAQENIAILLRGIYVGGEYINGPSNVAQYIYQYYSGKKLTSTSKLEHIKQIERIESKMCIFELGNGTLNIPIYRSTRIGINPNKTYATSLYRFLTHPERSGYKEKNMVIQQYLWDRYGLTLKKLTQCSLEKRENILHELKHIFIRLPYIIH